MLPHGRIYRLPTDAEWSAGVGLQGEEGTNPKEKSSKIKLYPWGKEWPPPKGAGNYAGEEAKTGDWPAVWQVIEGYNDGYPRTSPVGSFAANANGLYDMGGNVWQWCEDWYDAREMTCVLRRGAITSPALCLLRVATTSPLIIVTLISGFVVLWGLSLRGEAGLFPFALLALYLLRQPRSGPIFFMRETPQAA